ncbi:MAG: branched-chain amino acid ABC transporter permease [Clostridiales bacterium]|jgi:branched-chain amino acid transport system permease protein|nr:branched-chain amino acid ABC transporter permease [Clostridiales bacterium]
MNAYIQMFFSSWMFMSVFALATMGIVLIFKTSGTTNFAQGSIAALGAYFAATFVTKGWNLWLSLGVSVVVAFAVGVLVDVGLFRRGRSVNVIGKQIITMGIVMILFGVVPMAFGALPMDIPPFAKGNFEFGQFVIPKHYAICALITAGVLAAIFLALRFTKWGLGVRATASNEKVAQMLGVNTKMITAVSWALAAGLGTLAAVMYGSSTVLNPAYMTGVQVNAFLACILGGFATFYGPIAGALLLPVLRNYIAYNTSAWADVIIYTLILLVILFKPNGLFGKKIVKKV